MKRLRHPYWLVPKPVKSRNDTTALLPDVKGKIKRGEQFRYVYKDVSHRLNPPPVPYRGYYDHAPYHSINAKSPQKRRDGATYYTVNFDHSVFLTQITQPNGDVQWLVSTNNDYYINLTSPAAIKNLQEFGPYYDSSVRFHALVDKMIQSICKESPMVVEYSKLITLDHGQKRKTLADMMLMP